MLSTFWQSLSGRLLILTLAFVMLAEVLIFVPSVARFRVDYLRERVDKSQIAALAVEANPRRVVSEDLEIKLLTGAEVLSIAVKHEGRRELILISPTLDPAAATYDIRDPMGYQLILDAFATLLSPGERTVRVIGHSFLDVPRIDPNLGNDREVVEIVIDEAALRRAMLKYGVRIFWLSLFISAVTAALVFWSVNRALVRPISRVVDSIVSFRDDPEGASAVIEPSGNSSEIGAAERELALMQTDIRQALRQKSRLAALGEAVAKINHDLRNILASTQLLADRLEISKDPVVRRVGPKLVGSLDRAIRLCRETLEYGRSNEPEPQRRAVDVHALAEEIGTALGLVAEGPIRFRTEIPTGLTVAADEDQIFRAMLNIARNAAQAIESTGAEGHITIEARVARADASAPMAETPAPRATVLQGVEIDIIDSGPGLPERARENLFKPFQGSARKGGSGLGVAIAAELVKGHGGRLSLVESSNEGSRFRLYLPDPSDKPEGKTPNEKTTNSPAAVGETGGGTVDPLDLSQTGPQKASSTASPPTSAHSQPSD